MTHAIVVMGVAGSGKTTVGLALAELLRADFVDADDLHPADIRPGISCSARRSW